MKIIDALKKKEDKDENAKILVTIAKSIEKDAREHLKRVIGVLKEFDLHDESHSEKVIKNIEDLLGEEQIERLSIYELFLLHLSAFLHDCAMAPADWEINLFKITEGTKEYFDNEDSIKHDLKAPLKISEAVELIKERKAEIYCDFSGPSNWLFCPKYEKDFIFELAELLIEYQNFRNGYRDKFKKTKSEKDFKLLNKLLRINFIRSNHHVRIEQYIKNLAKVFEQYCGQTVCGTTLANDLAKICRAHGEDISYLEKLETKAQYYVGESVNLQFIAIMLRLGDIIHFSLDRAPMIIRSSKIFDSDYSFQQWAIKSNGVTYHILNGEISFYAYCNAPQEYFKLHNYIDWIEQEINYYFRLKGKWECDFLPKLDGKVNREGIKNNEDIFQPKRGLSFKLNQKRIIELLMGVGLYKEKYACIRELYQNSLDACRSTQGMSNINGYRGYFPNCAGRLYLSIS